MEEGAGVGAPSWAETTWCMRCGLEHHLLVEMLESGWRYGSRKGAAEGEQL